MKAIFSPAGLIVILVILVVVFFPRRPPDLRKPFRKRMRAFPEEPKDDTEEIGSGRTQARNDDEHD